MAEVDPPLTAWVFECPNDHPVFDVVGWELRDEKANVLVGFCPQRFYSDLCPECGAACLPTQYSRRRLWPRRPPALEVLHAACRGKHRRIALGAVEMVQTSDKGSSKHLEITELAVVDALVEGHPKVDAVLLSGMTLNGAASKLLRTLEDGNLL